MRLLFLINDLIDSNNLKLNFQNKIYYTYNILHIKSSNLQY